MTDDMIVRKYSVGMFFERIETVEALSLGHARKEAEKWAESICNSAEVVVSHIEVVEVTDGEA